MRTPLTKLPPLLINGRAISFTFDKILPYNPRLSSLAKEKRKAGILSEVIFWQNVSNKKFHNLGFDRQRVIGNYIVDFYIRKLGVVVEIDGCSHDDKIDYDRKRINYLEGLGLKIFIVEDIDVKLRMDLVLEDLEVFILKHFLV